MGNAGALNAFSVRTGADIAMQAAAAAVRQDTARMAELLQQAQAAGAATSVDGGSVCEDGAQVMTRAAGSAGGATCTRDGVPLLRHALPIYSQLAGLPMWVLWLVSSKLVMQLRVEALTSRPRAEA